mmetsp:Transcript_23817/g.66052  ORF Transcript_23817/g.66052 Transcript_23817/m.66052 type:complete len:313 (+) Transcript_23817:120-1058(+)
MWFDSMWFGLVWFGSLPPLDFHEGPVPLAPILGRAALGIPLRHNEEPQALVFRFHVEKLFHLVALAGGRVPRAPVAGQLGKLGRLDVHVLRGRRHGRGLFPLREAPGTRLPAHHNGNHVRAGGPPARHFVVGHLSPLVVFCLGAIRSLGGTHRTPADLFPVLVVVLERHVLHFHHGLFAKDHKLCWMLATLVVAAVEGSPDGSVQHRLDYGIIEGRGVSQIARWKDGAPVSDATQHGKVHLCVVSIDIAAIVVIVHVDSAVFIVSVRSGSLLPIPQCTAPNEQGNRCNDGRTNVLGSHGVCKSVNRDVSEQE